MAALLPPPLEQHLRITTMDTRWHNRGLPMSLTTDTMLSQQAGSFVSASLIQGLQTMCSPQAIKVGLSSRGPFPTIAE